MCEKNTLWPSAVRREVGYKFHVMLMSSLLLLESGMLMNGHFCQLSTYARAPLGICRVFAGYNIDAILARMERSIFS